MVVLAGARRMAADWLARRLSERGNALRVGGCRDHVSLRFGIQRGTITVPRRPTLAAAALCAALLVATAFVASTTAPVDQDALCRESAACWGERLLLTAGHLCSVAIEASTPWKVRWSTEGFTSRFAAVRWSDGGPPVLEYSGTLAALQNGFGDWYDHHYTCAYDPVREAVQVVRVDRGQKREWLPRRRRDGTYWRLNER